MERTEFLTEPRRTLCHELCGDDTAIPLWAWAEHGEYDEAEPSYGMETGHFFHDLNDSEVRHVELEDLPEEAWAFYADDRRNMGERAREAMRDPLVNQAGVFEAAKKLFILLGLSNDRRPMCEIVAHYFDPEMDPEPDCRMDGVINYFLKHKKEEGVEDAAVEFAEKMKPYLPEISLDAIRRLTAEALKERKQGQNSGQAFRLGQILCGTNWQRLLGAA